jgi:hypothetical protein
MIPAVAVYNRPLSVDAFKAACATTSRWEEREEFDPASQNTDLFAAVSP